MNEERMPPVEVPTLTEVVGFGKSAALTVVPAVDLDVARIGGAEPALSLRDLNVTEEQISQRVLVDLQRQVDQLFEYRLRETLAPLLTQLTDSFVREVRDELSSTLRDVVKRAVSQELARQRSR